MSPYLRGWVGADNSGDVDFTGSWRFVGREFGRGEGRLIGLRGVLCDCGVFAEMVRPDLSFVSDNLFGTMVLIPIDNVDREMLQCRHFFWERMPDESKCCP